ncbi:MAG: GNAT family N-acetyltransferase [Planctomycetes bacterium]|nr:GNAT family N-acetyltransferase [Planctomycetota bacterium]
MVRYVKADVRYLPKIEALENACFTVDAFSRRRLRNLVVSQHAIVLLAMDGDDVIGCTIGLTRKRVGYRESGVVGQNEKFKTHDSGLTTRDSIVGRLYSICVREDYRCRNIATELLSWLEGIFSTRGVERITLEVREHNMPARRFYEKHGFSEKDIITNYYRDGVNAVKMEKCLKHSIEETILTGS